MGRKYLILGASSDLGMNFIKNNDWRSDDEVVLQYHSNKKFLDKKLNCKYTYLQADFSSEESTLYFINLIKRLDFVPTHILYIPAIPLEYKRFNEYNWNDDVENQMNVQCRAFFLIIQSLIKKMTKQGFGKIVVILSSVTIGVPPKFLSVYVMVKYAMLGLIRSLAIDYASKNIQFNMVSPSMMETKFLKNVYEQVIMQSAIENPMRRNVKVEEVTSVIKYLFSDECSFMTGTNIPITGGSIF